MIDTHSHIYLEDFNEDRNEVLKRAAEAGVTDIYMPAITLDSLNDMARINHETIRFHKMAGLHPCEVGEELERDFYGSLIHWAEQSDIVGIGETGLDYYWSTDHVENQRRSFEIHCRIARECRKPVIIHNRESTKDMLDIVEEQQNGELKGIWHCFNGTLDEGKRAVDLGLHLGIGGVVTFKNGGVDSTVKELPLDKMVLETDAPYLSPAPNRGKRNEPAFMKYTAQKLAEIFQLTEDELDKKTSDTACQLFDKPLFT